MEIMHHQRGTECATFQRRFHLDVGWIKAAHEANLSKSLADFQLSFNHL